MRIRVVASWMGLVVAALACGVAHGQANLNLTDFDVQLYVDPVLGDDRYSGLDPSQPRRTARSTIHSLAKNYISQGKSTRVVLGPGVYREPTVEVRVSKGWVANDAVLMIEGATEGGVIFDGTRATGWEPHTWELVDPTKGIYRHDWTEDWGLQNKGWMNPLLQGEAMRREQVYVNGARMRPTVLEDVTSWVADKKIYWDYRGYRDPRAVLAPGSFGVAEMSAGYNRNGMSFDADPHGDADSIFLRLPAGQTIEDAAIEVTANQDALLIVERDNVAVRNLTFQRAASNFGQNGNYQDAMVRLGDTRNGRGHNNILVENAVFRQASGEALKFSRLTDATILNSRAIDNGATGFAMGGDNILGEHLSAIGNGWLAELSGTRLHGGGIAAGGGVGDPGVSGSRLQTFRHIVSRDNFSHGFRQDGATRNLLLQDALITGNRGKGVMIEIARGDLGDLGEYTGLVFDDVTITDNTMGVLVLGSLGVTFQDSIIANNELTQFWIASKDRRRGDPNSDLPTEQDWLYLINNVIQTDRGPDSLLFAWKPDGDVHGFNDFLRQTLFGMENRYWNPDNADMFTMRGKWVSGDKDDFERYNVMDDFDAWRAMLADYFDNNPNVVNEWNSVWAPTELPEPGTLTLALVGVGIATLRRRRRLR